MSQIHINNCYPIAIGENGAGSILDVSMKMTIKQREKIE
jgi:hypothetical protein